MKQIYLRCVAMLVAGMLCLVLTTPVLAKGGGSGSSGGSKPASSTSTRPTGGNTSSRQVAPKPAPVGSTVTVSQGTALRKPVTAIVPPPQAVGVKPQNVARSVRDVTVRGSQYSPSGFTTPSGRPAIFSPVTHRYVANRPQWYHSRRIGRVSLFGRNIGQPIIILDGYNGCLTCWDGPYAFAPVPFAPADWTQPAWAFDLEMLLILALILLVLVFGLSLLGRWSRRRRSYRRI